MSELNPQEIARQVDEDLRTQDVSVCTWYDVVTVPDGISYRHVSLDRAVVTFVGTREQVERVARVGHEIVEESKRGS